jgi:hypothetical protein
MAIKIDLYTNHDLFLKQRQQDWNIGRWLRSRGIDVQDLDSHPRIDDIILLINIRQSLWTVMNNSEQASWGGYWDSVYKKKNALKNKALIKFEKIAEQIQDRQQLIRQLRTGTSQRNKDHDMTAKGSCSPQVEHTAVEQRECRGDLAPWE